MTESESGQVNQERKGTEYLANERTLLATLLLAIGPAGS